MASSTNSDKDFEEEEEILSDQLGDLFFSSDELFKAKDIEKDIQQDCIDLTGRISVHFSLPDCENHLPIQHCNNVCKISQCTCTCSSVGIDNYNVRKAMKENIKTATADQSAQQPASQNVSCSDASLSTCAILSRANAALLDDLTEQESCDVSSSSSSIYLKAPSVCLVPRGPPKTTSYTSSASQYHYSSTFSTGGSSISHSYSGPTFSVSGQSIAPTSCHGSRLAQIEQVTRVSEEMLSLSSRPEDNLPSTSHQLYDYQNFQINPSLQTQSSRLDTAPAHYQQTTNKDIMPDSESCGLAGFRTDNVNESALNRILAEMYALPTTQSSNVTVLDQNLVDVQYGQHNIQECKSQIPSEINLAPHSTKQTQIAQYWSPAEK